MRGQPGSKAKERYSLFFVCIALFIAFTVWLGSTWFSDVPITSDIGSWPYQDGLTLTNLTVQASPNQIHGLSGHPFRMRYHLAGYITHSKGWRPKIARVQITSRVVSRSSNTNPATADVLLVPVVEVSKDENYSGEPVTFMIRLEQSLNTMDWGKNVYEVRCLNRAATASVGRYK